MSVAWRILGSFCGGKAEKIDTAENRVEAVRLAQEYRIAFGSAWVIWIEET